MYRKRYSNVTSTFDMYVILNLEIALNYHAHLEALALADIDSISKYIYKNGICYILKFHFSIECIIKQYTIKGKIN